MTNQHEDDDLEPTQTIAYKPGEKKSLEEYQNLDADDESLKKWKKSLGLDNSTGTSNGPCKVVVECVTLEFKDHEILVDFSNPKATEEAAKKAPFIIKQGSEYKLKVAFRVENDIVDSLKYVRTVEKKILGIPWNDKTEEMIGSYVPRAESYEKTFLQEEAPSGKVGRGNYIMKVQFIDSADVVHLNFECPFEIKKDWQ